MERPIHTRRKKALECERAARLARKGGSALYFGTAKINNDFDMLVGKENGKGMTAKSASTVATATVWRWLDGRDVHIDQAETSRAVR